MKNFTAFLMGSLLLFASGNLSAQNQDKGAGDKQLISILTKTYTTAVQTRGLIQATINNGADWDHKTVSMITEKMNELGDQADNIGRYAHKFKRKGNLAVLSGLIRASVNDYNSDMKANCCLTETVVPVMVRIPMGMIVQNTGDVLSQVRASRQKN